jgi:hypothetical protein
MITMDNYIERVDFGHGIVGYMSADEEIEIPSADWAAADTGAPRIYYLADSRYVLGSDAVDRVRMAVIAQAIRDGEMIGLPVYAYVHSGSTIWCSRAAVNPFGCPWDSAQSGFVACTKDWAAKHYGRGESKRVTRAALDNIYTCLEGFVAEMDQYLRGDVYEVLIEDDEDNVLDSVCGVYGAEYARRMLAEMGQACADQRARECATEALERDYWAARDVITQGE